MTIEQITAIVENKRVVAPKRDILEVKNAIAVYEHLDKLDPTSFYSFCEAHKILMNGLIESAGKLRSKSVGIVKGAEIAHIDPQNAGIAGRITEYSECKSHEYGQDQPV